MQLTGWSALSLAALAGGPDGVSLWPFAVLGITVLFIVISIAWLRLHAFLALMLAALLAGMLARSLPGAEGQSHWIKALNLPMDEFGATAAEVGFIIALASIIGVCLMESGAGDKIVRRFVGLLGEKRGGMALVISGFVLSIPVFFDTVFFLLIPLARAFGLRSGRDYTLFVLAICCGGVVTHAIVPPTPGPLIITEILGLDLGVTMTAGLAAGIIPALGGYWVARYLNRTTPIPLRETPGVSLAELRSAALKSEAELPSFVASIAPVLLPVVLISLSSFAGMAQRYLPGVVDFFGGTEAYAAAFVWIEFVGNKTVALLLGALIAVVVLARQRKWGLEKIGEMMGPPLETAGIIILITSAGGAFGGMIKHAGVGEAIRQAAEGREFNYILLAYLVAAVIRVAQGSATVAMITSSAMMAAVIGDGSMLGYHPLYLFLAIGFGATTLSWMNDGGFWIVGRLSGFTEKETLKTWTVLLTAISLIGLVETLLLSWLLPLV